MPIGIDARKARVACRLTVFMIVCCLFFQPTTGQIYEEALSTAQAEQADSPVMVELGLTTGLAWRDYVGMVWTWITDVWNFVVYRSGEGDARVVVTVGTIVKGLVFILIGILASRWASRWAGTRLLPKLGMPQRASVVVQSLLFYLLVVVFTLWALHSINVPLTAFTVLGGAVAIGIGFGSQNVMNNFISGLIILAERPIRIGDLVEIAGLYGTVERIGARSTQVRSPQNIDIIVPNSTFLENNVVNWTLSDDRYRAMVAVGVAYGSPVQEVIRLIRKTVDEHSKIAKHPEPIVLFSDFGDNALQFEVHFWIRMTRQMELRIVQSDIRQRIDQLFHEARITIAFPQRDVHLDTLSPLKVEMVQQSEASPESD